MPQVASHFLCYPEGADARWQQKPNLVYPSVLTIDILMGVSFGRIAVIFFILILGLCVWNPTVLASLFSFGDSLSTAFPAA